MKLKSNALTAFVFTWYVVFRTIDLIYAKFVVEEPLVFETNDVMAIILIVLILLSNGLYKDWGK